MYVLLVLYVSYLLLTIQCLYVAERVVGVDKQLEERDTPRREDAVVSRDHVIEQSSTEPKEEGIVKEGEDGLRDPRSGSEELNDSPDVNNITDDANIEQISKEEEGVCVGLGPSMEDEEVQEKKANSTDSEEMTVTVEGVSKYGGEGEKSFEVEAIDEGADGNVTGDSGSPSDDEVRDDDTPVEVTLADDSGEKQS